MNHFIIISGELRWIENMPENPMPSFEFFGNSQWVKETGGYVDPIKWYEYKLEQAKEKSIRVKNKEEVIKLIIDQFIPNGVKDEEVNFVGLKEGEIYTLDDSYKVDIINNRYDPVQTHHYVVDTIDVGALWTKIAVVSKI